jgi:hypothetical protein
MTKDDSEKQKTKDTAIAVAVIGVLGTVLVTFLTIYKDQLIPLLFKTPTATVISTFTDTPVTSEAPTFSPVILGIETRKTGESPDQIIFADINFRDQDGDSNLVKYELIETTLSSGPVYDDDPILTSPNRQIAGTILSIPW